MPTFPQRPRKSGVVVPHQVAWHGRLAARLIWLAVKICGATIRFEFEDNSGIVTASPSGRAPVIFCLWHNRLALSLRIREKWLADRGGKRPMAAIVSASRDGGLLARVLEISGIQPVRGSSSRRGAQALLELKSWAERGYDITITPDGPRGPRYVVQDGVVGLAQVTGLAIVPVNYHLTWKWAAKSWDRFQIPLPFARCRVRIEPPFHVPVEADEAARDILRRKLEAMMRKLNED